MNRRQAPPSVTLGRVGVSVAFVSGLGLQLAHAGRHRPVDGRNAAPAPVKTPGEPWWQRPALREAYKEGVAVATTAARRFDVVPPWLDISPVDTAMRGVEFGILINPCQSNKRSCRQKPGDYTCKVNFPPQKRTNNIQQSNIVIVLTHPCTSGSLLPAVSA